MRWRTVESVCKLLQRPKHKRKVVRVVGVTGKRGDGATGSQFQLQPLRKLSVDQTVDLAAVETRQDQDDPTRYRILQQPPIHQGCSWPDLMALLTPPWELTPPTALFRVRNLQAAIRPHALAQQQPNNFVANLLPSRISHTSNLQTLAISQKACVQPLHQAMAPAVLSQTKQTGNLQTRGEVRLHLRTLKASWSIPSTTRSRLTPLHQFPANINNKPNKAGATCPIQQISRTPPFAAHHLATLRHLKANHASRLLPQTQLFDIAHRAAPVRSIAVLKKKTRVMIWAMGFRFLWRRGRLNGTGRGSVRRRRRWRGSRLRGGRRGRGSTVAWLMVLGRRAVGGGNFLLLCYWT